MSTAKKLLQKAKSKRAEKGKAQEMKKQSKPPLVPDAPEKADIESSPGLRRSSRASARIASQSIAQCYDVSENIFMYIYVSFFSKKA